MSKQRVYEIAKQLNMDQKALVSLFQSMGIGDVRNHMSAVESDVVERVKRHLERQKTPEVVEERIRPTVVKRQRRATDEVPPARPSSPSATEQAQAYRPQGDPVAPPSRAIPAQDSGRDAEPRAASASARRAEPAAARQVASRTEPEAREPREPERAEPAQVGPQATPATRPIPSAAPSSSSSSSSPSSSLAPKSRSHARAEASSQAEPAAKAPPSAVKGDAPSQARHQAEPEARPPVMEMFEPVATGEPRKAPASNGDPQKPPQAPPVSAQAVAPARESEQVAPTPAPAPAPERESVPAQVTSASSDARPSASRPAVVPPPPAENIPAAVSSPAIPGPPAPPSVDAARALPDIGHTRVSPRPLPEAPATSLAGSPGGPARPSQPPGVRKTGIDTWEGRPGVPMPAPRATTAAPRRTMFDPRANQNTAQRPSGPTAYRPGPGGQRPTMNRGGPQGRFNNRGPQGPRKPAMVSTQEMSSHKKVIKIEEQVTLQQLAAKMSAKATDVLMKLLSLGMSGVHINSTLDAETAKILAGEFGWAVEDVAVSEQAQLSDGMRPAEEADLELRGRPPIVTVMGHVDHGKTSLLDRIRKATVAEGEAGGITQHIGAYRVETSKGTIAFLDTPGHEAFTEMRARGAKVTDIVILVVAADDGVMPQTREAISHAQAAKVPIVVAVNKIDKPGAEPDKIKRDLASFGLQPEEWGGETMFREVSAKTGQGIEELLEAVLLQAEVLELKANPKKRASGTVIEALLDRGRGPVARVMVQDGTLHTGDILLAGGAWGKVRAMTDELGRAVAEAGPATPVEVLGLNEVPSAGDPVHSVKDARTAEEIAETRRKKASKTLIPQDSRISLEGLADKLREADQLELKLIIKGDVQGSVEAVSHALAKLTAQKVRVTIVHAGVGGITEGDVNLAVASKAVIVGFNVRPAGKAAAHAESEGVEIRLYNIIYNAVDDIRAAMEGLLPATKVEKVLGRAEVRQVFPIVKIGLVAGCMVLSGTIRRTAEARLIRDNVVVWTGKLSGLRRFKDDAKEVVEGFECGISLESYRDIKQNDIVECFEIEEIKTKLT